MAIRCPSISTDVNRRGNACLVTIVSRRPIELVSVKMTAHLVGDAVAAQHAERQRRTALLHHDRRDPRIVSTDSQQLLDDPGPDPRIEIVDVGLDLGARRPLAHRGFIVGAASITTTLGGPDAWRPLLRESTGVSPRSLVRLPADAPLDDMLEAFRRDGGPHRRGMFNRATIGAMTAAADRHVPEFPPGSATQGMGAAGAAFVGANTVRFSSLPLLDDAYFDMLDNEIFAAIADAVLLPHCGSYWVNTGQIMYIGPGEAASPAP